MEDLLEALDPRCRNCQDRDCSNCTQFGTKYPLTDPPAPWPRSEPVKRPETKYSWKTSKYYRGK